MKNFVKIITLLLVITAALGLCACELNIPGMTKTGSESSSETKDTPDKPEITDNFEISDNSEDITDNSDADPGTDETPEPPVPERTVNPFPTSADGVKIGDMFGLGSFEQDNNTENGTEPIEWLVVGTDGNSFLVVSAYALEEKCLNDERMENVKWETCTLRAWLNGDFYENSFTTEEKAHIKTVTLVNDGSPTKSYISGGNDTEDKVFILSKSEIETYFSDTTYGICPPTETMIAKGYFSVYPENQMLIPYGRAYTQYWVRTPGDNRLYFCWYNSRSDLLSEFGTQVDTQQMCVRPAMWITV